MDGLPINKKILYGFGQIGVTMPAFFLSTYIFVFYAPLHGRVIVDSYIIGVAVLVGTLVQAFANPFIGQWSDKSTSRLGRRRFFLLTGLFPIALFYGLIWFPFLSGVTMGILLALYLIGFNFLYAYVVLPYLSLIPEISVTSKDRVILTTIASYFSIVGIILASLLPSILLTLNVPFSYIGLIVAILTMLSFLIVFLSIKENPEVKRIPEEYTIKEAIIQTFKNRTFDRYILSYLFFQFGFYFFLSSLGYFIENVVLPGNVHYEAYIGLLTLIAVLSTIAFSPLLVFYSRKHGEKSAFILFTAILGIVLVSAFFVGIIPFGTRIIQMIAIMILAGIGLTSYFILPNAIVSEIIDEDELTTGYRREGMYFGIQGLLERIPSGLSGYVLGAWISYLYLPTNNEVYIRSLALIGGLTIILTSLLFIRVPLKENIKKMQRS
ncbi:MFS transporter [Thermoplasma sp.]|uniref:MFS transporter n=1 Tax=Thermoplasma sp. TaxID=1973142 RepID=UPI002631B038|nr:MFS transporter [Thermoplasma sp.]